MPTTGGEAFPSQTWSTVLMVRDRESPDWKERLDRLVQAYWRPVWGYLIRRWGCSREDAADLAQEFFARECEEALGLKVGDVQNYVVRTRRELQKVLYRHVRDSVEHETDAEDEMRTLRRLLEA